MISILHSFILNSNKNGGKSFRWETKVNKKVWWIDGWINRWMECIKAVLMNAYSNQKLF